MAQLSVSVPNEQLEQDVRARLPEDLADKVDLFLWDMQQPTPRSRIDIVVPPYMASHNALPRLEGVQTRLVQGQSIGYDNVAEQLPAGHVFANAAGVHEASTAELALALTLASQRKLDRFIRQQDEHRWKSSFAPSLADRRVVVLGFGGVGRAVASRLRGFEVEIVPVATSTREEDGLHVHAIDELASLLPSAEILIVTLPDTPQTRGIIDDAVLSALPEDALLVNVGRGVLVDTDALVRHLHTGRIRAALDVTSPEPLPADHPLWGAPNLIISPHVGGVTTAMAPRMAKLLVTQITRLLADEAPVNVVLDANDRPAR